MLHSTDSPRVRRGSGRKSPKGGNAPGRSGLNTEMEITELDPKLQTTRQHSDRKNEKQEEEEKRESDPVGHDKSTLRDEGTPSSSRDAGPGGLPLSGSKAARRRSILAQGHEIPVSASFSPLPTVLGDLDEDNNVEIDGSNTLSDQKDENDDKRKGSYEEHAGGGDHDDRGGGSSAGKHRGADVQASNSTMSSRNSGRSLAPSSEPINSKAARILQDYNSTASKVDKILGGLPDAKQTTTRIDAKTDAVDTKREEASPRPNDESPLASSSNEREASGPMHPSPPPVFDLFASIDSTKLLAEAKPSEKDVNTVDQINTVTLGKSSEATPRTTSNSIVNEVSKPGDSPTVKLSHSSVETFPSASTYVPSSVKFTPSATFKARDAQSSLLSLSDLPQNWVRCVDHKSGYPYYYNDKTGESSWEKPVKHSSVKGTFSSLPTKFQRHASSPLQSYVSHSDSRAVAPNTNAGLRSRSAVAHSQNRLVLMSTSAPPLPSAVAGRVLLRRESGYQSFDYSDADTQMPKPGEPGYIPMSDKMASNAPLVPGDFSKAKHSTSGGSAGHRSLSTSSSNCGKGMFDAAPSLSSSSIGVRPKLTSDSSGSSSRDSPSLHRSGTLNSNAPVNLNAHLYMKQQQQQKQQQQEMQEQEQHPSDDSSYSHFNETYQPTVIDRSYLSKPEEYHPMSMSTDSSNQNPTASHKLQEHAETSEDVFFQPGPGEPGYLPTIKKGPAIENIASVPGGFSKHPTRNPPIEPSPSSTTTTTNGDMFGATLPLRLSQNILPSKTQSGYVSSLSTSAPSASTMMPTVNLSGHLHEANVQELHSISKNNVQNHGWTTAETGLNQDDTQEAGYILAENQGVTSSMHNDAFSGDNSNFSRQSHGISSLRHASEPHLGHTLNALTSIESALGYPGPLQLEPATGDAIADGIREARKIKEVESFIDKQLEAIELKMDKAMADKHVIAVDRLIWQTLSSALKNRGDLETIESRTSIRSMLDQFEGVLSTEEGVFTKTNDLVNGMTSAADLFGNHEPDTKSEVIEGDLTSNGMSKLKGNTKSGEVQKDAELSRQQRQQELADFCSNNMETPDWSAEKALTLAINNELWDHAILLSALISEDEQRRVIKLFTEHRGTIGVLGKIYESIYVEPHRKSDDGTKSLCKTLRDLLRIQSEKCKNGIIAIGDNLMLKATSMAGELRSSTVKFAHCCYIWAGLPLHNIEAGAEGVFQDHKTAQHRIFLVGAEYDSNAPGQVFDSALRRTEILAFCRAIKYSGEDNKNAASKSMKVAALKVEIQLLYASILCEHEETSEQANKYVNYLSRPAIIKHFGDSSMTHLKALQHSVSSNKVATLSLNQNMQASGVDSQPMAPANLNEHLLLSSAPMPSRYSDEGNPTSASIEETDGLVNTSTSSSAYLSQNLGKTNVADYYAPTVATSEFDSAPPELSGMQNYNYGDTHFDYNATAQLPAQSGSVTTNVQYGEYSKSNGVPFDSTCVSSISHHVDIPEDARNGILDHQENQSDQKSSFLSSAFNVLERVIHGDEEEDDHVAKDGKQSFAVGDEKKEMTQSLLHKRSNTGDNRPSWASDDGNHGVAAARSRINSVSGSDETEKNSDSRARAKSLSSSNSDERRGSWFEGVFRSKKDRKKEANMGKKLDAYFDKSLNKWIFPDDGNAEDGADVGIDDAPPKMPLMQSQKAVESRSMDQSQAFADLPPNLMSSSLGKSAQSQPRRPARYASFGMPVIAQDVPAEDAKSITGNSASRPGGNLGGQLPGIF